MKKLLKKLPFEIAPVSFAAIAIVIGIILLILPETSLKLICLVIGIAIGTKGLTKLIKYINDSREDKSKTSDLIVASVILGLAIILMIHPKPVLSVFPTIVGIGILVYGIVTLLTKGKESSTGKITSVVAIVLGVIVINSPMFFAEATTSLVGLSLVVIGIFTIVTEIKIKKRLDDLHLPPSDGYTEVEFKDVDE